MLRSFSLVFFAACLLFGASASAQAVCDSVYTLADEMPYYGAGQKDIFAYLNKNLEVKKPCKPADLKRIIFIVAADGKISDIEVIGAEKCKDDLIRQIQGFPNWTPGKSQGKPVCVRVVLPIQLHNKKE